MVKGVLLDLSGVVYQGDHLLPGAAEAIARLRDDSVPLRFLTNSTRTPKRRIIERLRAMGLQIAADEVFTPAQAARDWLIVHDLSPFLVVHPDLVAEFAGVSGTQGEAVVVGDAGETLTYDLLNEAFRRLIDGAEFVALARNRTFRDHDGELSLDAGPFVAALEFATRHQATVLGKPTADFFGMALSSMDCAAKDAVMVGDDAEADVAGALAAGIGTALLVRTGKYRPGDERKVKPTPSDIVEDLAAAARWIMDRLG